MTLAAQRLQQETVALTLVLERLRAQKEAAALRASYDAAQASKRRTQRKTDLRREDDILKPKDRDKVVSDSRNLRRNSADVAWAIRKHLDYVSTFSFRATNVETDNATLTDADGISAVMPVADAITLLVKERSQKEFADVTSRFDLHELIRMTEGMSTTDGDTFIYKLYSGKIQLIEGDRVRQPKDVGDYAGQYSSEDFVHGVQLNADGKPLRYAISDRNGNGGYRLSDVANARYVIHHGTWERYDQARPISPLAAAINNYCDLHESREFALAKMKLAQLFGVKLKRGPSSTGLAEGSEGPGYEITLDGSPQFIDLEQGDDIDIITGGGPSTDFQAFYQIGLATGLKALDIPYSFHNESFTNYSGQRQAWIQYDESANNKRGRNRRVLDDWTRWQIFLAILDERLILPPSWTIKNISWEWVSRGIPWIDPLKEVQADKLAVDNYQSSPQRVCKARGEDFFEIVDEIAEAIAYLQSKGLPLPQAWAQGVPINEVIKPEQ